MRFIGKLKTWKLFMLMVAIPVLFQVGFTSLMISANGFRLSVLLIPFSTLLFTVVYCAWIWFAGVNLSKLQLKPDKRRVLILSVSIILLPGLVQSFTMQIPDLVFGREAPASLMGVIMTKEAFIVKVICSILLYFLVAHLTANAFKSVQLNRQVALKEFVPEIILLLFPPVGLWVLHKRVCRLLGDNDFFDKKKWRSRVSNNLNK